MTPTQRSEQRAGRTRLARARKSLTPDQLFFFEHAGYSYDAKVETAEEGRRRCAIELAAAEQYAQSHGWLWGWEYDQDADLSWMTPEEQQEEHETFVCCLYDDGEVLASLCGITDPDRNYRRVVEAELADEAMASEQRLTESRRDAVVAMN